jgi:hypothetical protein
VTGKYFDSGDAHVDHKFEIQMMAWVLDCDELRELSARVSKEVCRPKMIRTGGSTSK